MNIVKPYAVMLKSCHTLSRYQPEDGINALRTIEFLGRISHRSEDKQTTDSYLRFIDAVCVKKGDWSITEHAMVTVDAVMDRGITHEWVRHRHFSFTQESTRFVNYEKKMPASFICPIDEELTNNGVAMRPIDIWKHVIMTCEQGYKDLIGKGVSPQIARSVFPNALASRIATTGNIRAWRHFLRMRTTKEAHPQMREITIPLLEEFQRNIPLLFDDIEPLATQSHNLTLAC